MIVERQAQQRNNGQQKQENGRCLRKPPGEGLFHKVTPGAGASCERLSRQSTNNFGKVLNLAKVVRLHNFGGHRAAQPLVEHRIGQHGQQDHERTHVKARRHAFGVAKKEHGEQNTVHRLQIYG